MRSGYRTQADSFQTRLLAVATGAIFLMVLIGVRLFTESVIGHESTQAKAEQQYLVRQAVTPRRGTIYASDAEALFVDSNHPEQTWQPLATNNRTYALSVVPHDMKDYQATANFLATWAQVSAKDLLDKISNRRLYLPPLRHGLTEDDKDQITQSKLPGIFLTEELNRFYPDNHLASQLLGFVNADGKGNYGLEQKYDEDLRGSGGEVIAERDVQGRLLTTQDERPVRDGSSLVLTIDRNVQSFVETTLKNAVDTYQADAGTAIVMDVKTGGIVAMANTPDFDPNTYNAVPKDQHAVFTNPAIEAVFEPGSIFKTLILAAAIESGDVEPDTASDFGESVQVQGYTIHTAEHKAFGHETMTQVLANSDNVGMVWVGNKLGNQKMHDAIKRLGFGDKSGIDLPGEVGGVVQPLKNWVDISRATMSFGQGISVTPLQIVSAYAAIANGGTLMQPHIVSQIIQPEGTFTTIQSKVIHDHVISPETSSKVLGMLVYDVTNGLGHHAAVPGYLIGGKTGTAQIPDAHGGYDDSPHSTIGSFAGVFPADNPRFAMLVKLDRPKTVNFAESSAAPTFGQLARFILNYYRIPPNQPIPQK